MRKRCKYPGLARKGATMSEPILIDLLKGQGHKVEGTERNGCYTAAPN